MELAQHLQPGSAGWPEGKNYAEGEIGSTHSEGYPLSFQTGELDRLAIFLFSLLFFLFFISFAEKFACMGFSLRFCARNGYWAVSVGFAENRRLREQVPAFVPLHGEFNVLSTLNVCY